MRKHILVLALGLLTSISFGQTLSAGDIVVIGYDVESADIYGDGLYLLTLVDLATGTEFFITDQYWDGVDFSENVLNEDGTFKLTVTQTISAGEMIFLQNVQVTSESGTSFEPSSSLTLNEPITNDKMNLQPGSDVVYIYQGSFNDPDNFVTAFSSRGFIDNSGGATGTGTLINSGLIDGVTAFDLRDGDPFDFNAVCAIYNGTTQFANQAEALTAIYNDSNWAAEENQPGVNDSQDSDFPNLPDDLSGFSVSLPIELISFTVRKYNEGNALIQWSSAMEINNDYYEVERAGADLRFNTIETIDGAIESTEVLSYEVIDEQPLDGVNYYRLKQVDLDGTASYFDVRSVDFGSDQQGLVFPNPVKGKIFISGESYLGAQYNVIDLSGAVKMTGVVTKEQLKLSAEGLEEGIYFLQLVSNGTTHTYKFSKI